MIIMATGFPVFIDSLQFFSQMTVLSPGTVVATCPALDVKRTSISSTVHRRSFTYTGHCGVRA